MAEEKGAMPADGEVSDPAATVPDAATLKAELDGARARIKELNTENERRRKEAAEREAADAAAEEERKAKQGEFESLAEQRKKERDALNAELTTARESLNSIGAILNADIDNRCCPPGSGD